MSQQTMYGSFTFESIAITNLSILQSKLECPLKDVWFCNPGNYCHETVFLIWNLEVTKCLYKYVRFRIYEQERPLHSVYQKMVSDLNEIPNVITF